MNKALRLIFWGYVFILFDIHIVIDLFMDPIGYLLFVSGCSKLVGAYPIAKKAKLVGLFGVFISLPSVIVNLSDANLYLGWVTYASLVFIMKLIMGYYLFLVLKDVAKAFGDRALQQRTESTFKFYVAIHLLSFALLSFSINIPDNSFVTLTIISAFGVLLMDILFLFLVRALRRVSGEQLRVNTFI